MKKFLKMLIGIGLLPSCWAVSTATYQLYRLSGDAGLPAGFDAWALPTGFLIWIALYFLLPRPTRAYVLGHELTHALWALMMGGRVGRIRIGREGGHVELSRTNFLITLAPYFFPFYTFVVIGLYYLAGTWLQVEPYRAWWLAAVGFCWAFHVTFTLHMLSEHQPDIREHGRLFSYVIIYLMNVLVIGVWMVMVGEPRIAVYSDLLAHEHAVAYNYSARQVVTAWVSAARWIEGLK
jgi:hypothetical protein